MCLITQLGVHGTQTTYQHSAAAFEHQGVRNVVDVFRRACEMDEFGGTAQRGTVAPLDPVLDRLDVMIGLRLDRLDFDAIFEAEVSHQLL